MLPYTLFSWYMPVPAWYIPTYLTVRPPTLMTMILTLIRCLRLIKSLNMCISWRPTLPSSIMHRWRPQIPPCCIAYSPHCCAFTTGILIDSSALVIAILTCERDSAEHMCFCKKDRNIFNPLSISVIQESTLYWTSYLVLSALRTLEYD